MNNYSLSDASIQDLVDDYIIFYYPREDGISVARVASGYRDLEFLFADE